MTREELADLLIERLNEITAYDPEAMRRLLEARVECNDALADHPSVQVRARPGEPCRVGLLGVLQGIVGGRVEEPHTMAGAGLIAAVLADDGSLLGFRRTELEDNLAYGGAVEIVYTNWKGERGCRRILPRRIQLTYNKWHPTPQWLLYAHDLDKGAERTFALKDIERWTPVPEDPPEGAEMERKLAASPKSE